MNTDDCVVKAVGLTKTFRDFWGRPKARAVNDIDFEVRRGEVVGLLGPNGSGKSTTVKMLLGLLYPTAGKLTVLGKSPRAVETKKEIGYLPEESYLYKYLTAAETLDFFGALFNIPAAERARRIDQLLEMVGLSHARNRRVGEFSKGMARRVGLAQAMINDPAFLVLDEPTSGLDPLGCREVKDLILNLKRRGKTVLVTSHLLSDVQDVCDRVIILYGGRIRSEGPLDQLLSVSDETEIVAPRLPEKAEEEIRDILRNVCGDKPFTIDNPRRTLEEYFLEVIARAKQESVETSGAALGGAMPEYLSAGERENASRDDAEKAKLLSSLVSEPAPPETPEDAPAEAEKSAPAEAGPEPGKILEKLVDDGDAPAGPPAEAAKEDAVSVPEKDASADEALRRADEKLNELFGSRRQ